MWPATSLRSLNVEHIIISGVRNRAHVESNSARSNRSPDFITAAGPAICCVVAAHKKSVADSDCNPKFRGGRVRYEASAVVATPWHGLLADHPLAHVEWHMGPAKMAAVIRDCCVAPEAFPRRL